MVLPILANQTVLLPILIAMLAAAAAGPAPADAGWWSGPESCIRPASKTNDFDTPWYEWSSCDGFCPVYTCDRAPRPVMKKADLCRLAADSRHSAGLADAEQINTENDGLSVAGSRTVAGATRQPSADEVAPHPGVAVSREDQEYPYPMSRCDDYWCDPWCECPWYENPGYGSQTAEPLTRAVDPVAAIDVSICRVTLRPVVSAASNLLGGIGEQLLALSRALDQLAAGESTPELPATVDPERVREPVWQAAWPELHLGL